MWHVSILSVAGYWHSSTLYVSTSLSLSRIMSKTSFRNVQPKFTLLGHAVLPTKLNNFISTFAYVSSYVILHYSHFRQERETQREREREKSINSLCKWQVVSLIRTGPVCSGNHLTLTEYCLLDLACISLTSLHFYRHHLACINSFGRCSHLSSVRAD